VIYWRLRAAIAARKTAPARFAAVAGAASSARHCCLTGQTPSCSFARGSRFSIGESGSCMVIAGMGERVRRRTGNTPARPSPARQIFTKKIGVDASSLRNSIAHNRFRSWRMVDWMEIDGAVPVSDVELGHLAQVTSQKGATTSSTRRRVSC
jgi:hypothetical protein